MDEYASDFTHIGWIPCVSGHLDFSLTKVGLAGGYLSNDKKDNQIQTVNYLNSEDSTRSKRRVALQSWVDWQDDKNKDGEFRVVVTAEGDESRDLDARALSGYICIFPRKYKSEFPEAEKFLMDKVGALNEQSELFRIEPSLNNLNKLDQCWEALQEIMSSDYPLSDNEDGLQEVYVIKFLIGHDGFIYLAYKNIAADRAQPICGNDKYIIIRQAFYYLKYAIHNHNHHTSESDALTTIIEYESAGKQQVGLQLLGQLKRELIRIKRIQKTKYRRKDDSEALGILGYMRSLLRSCLEENFLTKSIYERELEWIQGTAESFHAQHSSINDGVDRIEAAGQFSRQWVAILLAFASLFSLLWVNINNNLTSARSEGWIFDLMRSDVKVLLFAYCSVAILLWVVSDTIAKFRLIDQNPRVLRNLFKATWVKAVLSLLAPLALVISIMCLVYFWEGISLHIMSLLK